VNLTDLIVRAKEPRRSSRKRSRRRYTRTSRGVQRRPSSPDLTNLTGRVQGHGLSNTGRVNIHHLVRTTVSPPQPNYSHDQGNRIGRISTLKATQQVLKSARTGKEKRNRVNSKASAKEPSPTQKQPFNRPQTRSVVNQNLVPRTNSGNPPVSSQIFSVQLELTVVDDYRPLSLLFG